MLYAVISLVIYMVALLLLMFLGGLVFIVIGLVKDWLNGTSDHLSRALLVLCVGLILERLWWAETFLRFSLNFEPTWERLINFVLYFFLLIFLNMSGLYLTWRLYRDDEAV